MNLSIVIPVYNVALYLENCVLSVYNQGLDPLTFEVILINDGSTDNSYKICQDLEKIYSNIRVLTHENRGLSATRNVGIDEAKGKYVYFIDSDDYLESNYLNRFLEIALTNDLCWISFDKFKTHERFISSKEVKELELIKEGDGIELIANSNVDGVAWNYIVKREVIGDVRFIEVRTCEDVPFTFDIVQNVQKGQVYRNKVYGYFFNDQSIVRTKNIKGLRQFKDGLFFLVVALDKIIDRLPKNHPSTPKAFLMLRERQEICLYFGIVRLLRLKEPNSVLKKDLAKAKKSKYPVYPIKVFKGYDSRVNKVLIQIVNREPLLLALNTFNRIFKVLN